MGLSKQAKTLNKNQVSSVVSFLTDRRNGTRNVVMFLLSVKSGLRAKEISSLKWIHLVGSDGSIGDVINLPNIATKGNSGRVIPLNKDLKKNLQSLFDVVSKKRKFNLEDDRVIVSERGNPMDPQVVVNWFYKLYNELGFIGCSSHSGRRTFITQSARLISSVGGSLRDVQQLAGHSSLTITQRYIEGSEEAKNKVINLI